MIISEVNAVFDLVLKATSFYTRLKDGWYKGSSELDVFYDKVLMLDTKHSQWREQLQRYGVSETSYLLHVVKRAEQALEKQQELVTKLQKSPFRRLKRRVFPGELSYLFEKVLHIVNGGPELLATKLANNDLLERDAAQTPVPLPFGQDENYVPIVNTIMEVQRALESTEVSRVVTVHGEPGMGKTCLAKHIAVHYVEENQRLYMNSSSQKPAVFPDGVYYLLCGRQADKRLKQLQLELLQSLGFGTTATAPIESAASSRVHADCPPLPLFQMKLRSRLAEQKLLIILDDLWEETVLQEVLVPAKGVKYLITSQRRDIFIPAKKIQIRRPTKVEARSIMANYTDGLPIKGQFPPNIQTVTDDIIGKLEYHPLSLANIGVSINSSWATNAKQWEVISANLYLHLDENDLRQPPAYDRDYSLPVSASMMLMVDSLSAEEKRLLFVMALLGGQRLPEPLVKYFYRFIQTTGFALKYNNQEKLLEDKSLIQKFRGVDEDMSLLDCHRLRSHYIRDTKTHEVRSLGSQILTASGSQDVGTSIERGDSEETLVAILGGIYYDPVFKNIVRSTLKSHATVLNGGVMPKSLNIQWTDIPINHVQNQTDTLVCLLNVDNEEEVWKKQAHEYAKKIIIKFICKGKLDDGSMANLLKLHPQTTSVACTALRKMYWCHANDYYAHDITFSIAYREIMETLLALLHDNGISTKRREAVMSAFWKILNFESKDTILAVGAQYRSVLAMHSKPEGQVAVMNVLSSRIPGRGYRILTGSPGLLEDLMGVLLLGRKEDPSARLILKATRAIEAIVSRSTRLTLRVAEFPNALQMLSDLFVSQDTFEDPRINVRIQKAAGKILSHVTIVAENRIKVREIQGIWDGLGAILVKQEGARRNTRCRDLHELEERASVALWILGNLSLEKDLRNTIASLPCVRLGFPFLQTAVLSAGNIGLAFAYTRALTILHSKVRVAMPSSLINVQALEEALEATAACDERPSPEQFKRIKCTIYWSQSLAHLLMGSYAESVSSLDHAQRHFHTLEYGNFNASVGYTEISLHERSLRGCRVFLQAMLGDYTGAFQTAGTLDYDFARNGVLKRLSGDLQGALDDFNTAAEKKYKSVQFSADILKQRGYVKYLLDDEAGARKDAEMAQQIAMVEEELGRPCYRISGDDLWDLTKLPVSYLGFSF